MLLCLMFLLLSCSAEKPEPLLDSVTDYHYPLKKVAYAQLFKNRTRLFNSHLALPADSNGVHLFEQGGKYYYHPVTLCFKSLEALNDYSITGEPIYLSHAIKTMETLRRHAVRHQDMLYFPYNFDFSTTANLCYKAPWYSAMAQGLALGVYSRLYYFTKVPLYTAVADSILRSMTDFESDYSTVMIAQDDTLLGRGTYYWIDEYPNGPRRFVLNGSIIGAMGLYDHWWVYGDDLSRQLFSAELSTVKDKVLAYRNPDDLSAYCLKYRRKYQNYHLVHCQLLDKCEEMTGDAYFAAVAELFRQDHPVRSE